jgi:hypothetical protein
MKLIEEQRKKEEDLLLMEHDYNDLQEEVTDKTKLLSKLRKRYKGALAEIQDLESEHLNEKSEYLDAIRRLEIDLSFYKTIVYMMMNENNLYKIKTRSNYDDETCEWEIPPFVLKGKQVNLPKLGLQKARQFIEEEKNNQIVDFKEMYSESEEYLNDETKVSNNMLNVKIKKKKANRHKSQAPKHKKLKHQNYSAPIDPQEIDEVAEYSGFEEEDQFRQNNGLHDYKGRFDDDSNEFGTPNPGGATKKPHFLSQQPKRDMYNAYDNSISSESKLPPSLRWALAEEDQEDDEDAPWMYQRNQKVNAHLAPLGGMNPSIKKKLYQNGAPNITASANTIYGGQQQNPIDRIPSIKKLSSQKTRRLQPLRK